VEGPSPDSILAESVSGFFAATGRWPTVHAMYRKHVRMFDVWDVAGRASRMFRRENGGDDEILKLTWEGLATTKNGIPILRRLHRVLLVAVERFLDPAVDQPTVSSADLVAMNFSPTEVAQAYQLVRDGDDVWRGIDGNINSEWVVRLARGVRRFSQQDFAAFVDSLKLDGEGFTGAVVKSPGPKRSKPSPPVANTAFILMWMATSEPSTAHACQAIKRACHRFGIEAQRADDIEHQDVVMEVVLDRIRAAEYVVCDLTGERPNVYYELGYAHALGKRPVLVRKAGTPLHFDIQGYNVVAYSNPDELETALVRRFEALTGKKPQQQS
jgi:hypothetical protein